MVRLLGSSLHILLNALVYFELDQSAPQEDSQGSIDCMTSMRENWTFFGSAPEPELAAEDGLAPISGCSHRR